MREREWQWPDNSSRQLQRGERIARELKAPVAIGEALASRKSDDFDPRALAQRPLADCTASMGEPPGTAEAAATLLQAARTGRLGILCDFDVDGATSQAILVETLRQISGQDDLQPPVAVPERNTEGFGPNPRCLDQLARAGVTCIAILDCGTAAGFLLDAFCEANGIDVVVIDHHPPHGDQLPNAAILLNPWATAPTSPGEHGTLCAAGLTWFVARSMLRQCGLSKDRAKAVLQRITLYAALGTSCDLMPLDVPFNRSLVRHGVRLLGDLAARGWGLSAICDAAKLGQSHCSADFGWKLGPRLNAGSRMGESDLAARCLRATDRDTARELAQRLERHNQERRDLGKRARAELDSRPNPAEFDGGPVNV
ncbi:MAG: DHH family phosphoesterase, partial [Bryobacterales bacterium]|nr:DHH family phosphoesterase [Bryobacterales bacterium]